MTNTAGSSSHEWFWSQAGATLGPVDLAEIQRLVANGSIKRDTWVFDPAQRAWVAAEKIAGLFDAPGAASAVPPPGQPTTPPTTPSSTSRADASVVYCRVCGATNSPFATRCASCGHAAAPLTAGGIDPKLAAVFCRVSVLATPLLTGIIIGPAIAPAIVWVLGSRAPAIVAEAKETFNCLITLAIIGACATVFGLVGAIIIVPAILAAIVLGALAVYCVVVGIMGLVALSNDRPFRYPWILRLIK